ncbi:probable G-protein coupled receptor 132 [Gadus chalcogrammus]|uniref:probable G-protein coupled receptor 132 n=1 Tax=Gadus chalcogrammus TaxID=1042646 RepID=UPI0024C4D896|nr:probable G-protein coupled receptor 132 [Gadus chalcogrammus]XP_056437675.1 probable G-protein coupled receptor 132 [Gadus chalcogrammus]
MQAEATTAGNATTVGNATTAGNAMACAPPYDQARVPMVVLYSVIFVVGFPANLLTVWFTWRQVRRKNVLGVYLCSLSVCDLIYLSTLPLWALYFDGCHKWAWGSRTCQVTGFVFYTNMYISILLLCCVSCDRYVAVRYALESRGLRRPRVAAGITAAIVAMVMAVHVPVFLIREGEMDHKADMRCFEPDHDPSGTVTAFSYMRLIMGFVVPLALLTASNCGILRAVRASHSLQLGQKRRVRWLAVAVVTLFLVGFAPYHLVLLVRAAFSHSQNKALQFAFFRWIYEPYYVSVGFSTLNSACNPLLYVLSSGDAREELSLVLRGQSEGTMGTAWGCNGEVTTRSILYRSGSRTQCEGGSGTRGESVQ